MTVCAPLKLAHRETISPALIGRTLCTEVAEQVPYWVAMLTPAERPLLSASPVHFSHTSVTLPGTSDRGHSALLASLGAASFTWQALNFRGSSAGVLVDLQLDGGALHPIRLPAVHTDTLAGSRHLVDEVSRRLGSVPNGGRDYALTRNYPALASRGGAQIIVRDDASADPNGEYAIDIALTTTDSGTTLVRITWAEELQGVDELVRLWSAATYHLATSTTATTSSSAA